MTNVAKSVLLLLFLIPVACWQEGMAQTVSSFKLSTPIYVDGFRVGPDGTIYTAGSWKSPIVQKVAPDGTVTTIAEGLNGPTDIVRDAEGNLYVSEYNGTTISKITPEGAVSEFATVAQGPAGLEIGPDGALYVSIYGKVNGDGTTVIKISPDGKAEPFVSGQGIEAPIGLTFDDQGNLYVANSKDGKIHKVDSKGQVSLVATVPGPATFFNTGHLVYAGGKLYASGNGSHRVYEVSLAGEVNVLAGTGERGTQDGPAKDAQFSVPNGLAASPDGKVLYVASGAGQIDKTLRMITLQ